MRCCPWGWTPLPMMCPYESYYYYEYSSLML